MARIVKEHSERHSEFLDVAQTLFFTKGYEQTSVQDIINTVGVAKGTFYHYFRSKGEILDAMVKRMYEQKLTSLEPMLADDALDAKQKFEQFFGHVAQWKTENKALMLETARTLYRDENVLLREKAEEQAIATTTPILAKIIEQGIAEGAFDVDYPRETAELIFAMLSSLSKAIVMLLLSEERDETVIERMKRHAMVCNQGVARVLGMSDDSIKLVVIDHLDAWL